MAILTVGKTMWESLSDTYKLHAMQTYTVEVIPDDKYAVIMRDMVKVTGSAPKEEKKGKVGKKHKKGETEGEE